MQVYCDICVYVCMCVCVCVCVCHMVVWWDVKVTQISSELITLLGDTRLTTPLRLMVSGMWRPSSPGWTSVSR